MAEDGRSLGATLVAAASTFALFVVTSMPPVRSSFKWRRSDLLRFVGEFLDNLSVVAFLPVTPFITMLVKVMYVSQLRRRLKKMQPQVDVDYVTTMAFCRIFIQLRSRVPYMANIPPSSPSPISPWLRTTHPPLPFYNPPDWEEGEAIDKERVYSREVVESFDPLELCFAGEDANHTEVQNAGCLYLELHSEDRPTRDLTGLILAEFRRFRAGEDSGMKAFMQKMARFFQPPLAKQFKEREALILALPQLHLSQSLERKIEFARDKGRTVFPNVVRASQAMGYMWSVLERAVQLEPISPVEAILTFLSILVTLQVLMELYACARYSRVLVLCLSQQQYTEFFKARKDENRTLTSFYFKTAQVSSAVMVGVIGIPFFYQAFFLYGRTCHLCFLSGFVFLLAPIVSILDQYMNYSVFCFLRDVRLSNGAARLPRAPFLQSGGIFLLSYIAYILSVTCVIMALVATVRNWKLFNKPTAQILYSWIIPHISS